MSTKDLAHLKFSSGKPMRTPMNSITVDDNFREAIERTGLTPPDTIIADGTLHRFSSNGDPGDKAGWYVFFDDGSPVGAFGCWRTGIKRTWHAGHNGHTLAAKEKALEWQRMEVVRRQREEDTQRRHKEAADRAQKLISASRPAPADHPYLQEKRITTHGLTVDSENRLLVPVRIAGHLTSLQTINTSGEKRFLVGGEIKGGFYLLGTVQDVAMICEGFATGASVHEATGHGVVVALSASNLLPVAQAIRGLYPTAAIILAGDKDRSGVGQKAAIEAAAAVGGTVAIPTEEGMDWNDIAVRDGLEAINLAFANPQRSHYSSTEKDAQLHTPPADEKDYVIINELGNPIPVQGPQNTLAHRWPASL